MNTTKLSVQERIELGQERRKAVPRSAHGDWVPTSLRADPVALLEQQNDTRVDFLVPIRHERMRVSPFTFFRGAARIMAADLATTPSSGLEVQLGGDAHLSNFGAYASPERRLVFDQNDFDETLPGPWEWDLKRLATSVMIAAQHLGFTPKQCRKVTMEVTRSYRAAMAEFAQMGYLQLWYEYIGLEDVRAQEGAGADLDVRLARFEKRATRKTSLQALDKLAERVGTTWRIRSTPPVLFPLRDLPADFDVAATEAAALGAFEAYKPTLDDNRHQLLDRYEVVDIGVKVVGVGSVGTRCLLILLQGRDENDPLFLQAKEATASVLEDHLPASRYENHGRRVVEGQRLVQAQSDIFLGWTTGSGVGHHDFYVRQLRDWKGSVEVDVGVTPNQLAFYARLCGHTLARGHARTGDAEAIGAYVGKSETLDRALTAFAEAYSIQNLADYRRFEEAITEGRLAVP